VVVGDKIRLIGKNNRRSDVSLKIQPEPLFLILYFNP